MDKQSIDDVGKSRIAIIGTGLAGLTTGYLLQADERKRYSVTLFEQVRDIHSVQSSSILDSSSDNDVFCFVFLGRQTLL
jgi:predicted NAD/FAD-binding protein